jgi:hypothetical protein
LNAGTGVHWSDIFNRWYAAGQLGVTTIISSSDGVTWVDDTVGGPIPFGGTNGFAVYSANGRLLAGGNGGSQSIATKTSAAIGGWNLVSAEPFSTTCACFISLGPNVILAGGFGTNSLGLSNDGGVTWSGQGTAVFSFYTWSIAALGASFTLPPTIPPNLVLNGTVVGTSVVLNSTLRIYGALVISNGLTLGTAGRITVYGTFAVGGTVNYYSSQINPSAIMVINGTLVIAPNSGLSLIVAISEAQSSSVLAVTIADFAIISGSFMSVTASLDGPANCTSLGAPQQVTTSSSLTFVIRTQNSCVGLMGWQIALIVIGSVSLAAVAVVSVVGVIVHRRRNVAALRKVNTKLNPV